MEEKINQFSMGEEGDYTEFICSNNLDPWETFKVFANYNIYNLPADVKMDFRKKHQSISYSFIEENNDFM